MTKKTLDESSIVNELTGQSAFFQKKESPTPVVSIAASDLSTPLKPSDKAPEAKIPESNSQQSTEQASEQASMLASYHDSLIETIRKAVKDVGKEVTFVRLTLEEKEQIAEIVYSYRKQHIKTSENEISRIALSFLLEDYRQKGQESILAKVIASLRA